PIDLQTGVYQGFLNFQNDRHEVNAPVSFVIKESITENDSTILIKGKQSDEILYGNGYTKGAFDMVNRYMAGDWRQYYFDIQNEFVNSAAIEISWTSDDTNLAVFVMDPLARIVQTNVPSGVFGHFLGWPSLDWLGNTPFSQGGGFFPVKNKDDASTVLYVPINQTGTYTLLTHSTLFGGNSTTEPITLAAKFTNISSEDMSQYIEIITEDEISSDLEKTTKNETQTSEKEPTPIESTVTSDDLDSLLLTGIGIGIGIGIAIGIVSIIVLRQKSVK
ncbi:peptidase S8-S53 subtilisin kexin sedolisin protein, partial [Marine Group I thaumarchaeote SCGC AAA799-D11]